MSADDNLASARKVYEAFGQGDVDSIVAICADNVDWAPDAEGDDCPWWGSYTKDSVPRFFAAIGDNLDVLDFQVVGMGASDNEVFVFIHWRAKARATGKEFESNLHHYWRFNADGKIEYYRGSEDTKQASEALAA